MTIKINSLLAALERTNRMATAILSRIEAEISGVGQTKEISASATKWEYTSLQLDAQPEDFTQLGSQGWELVLQSLLDGSFVFKRAK